MKTIVACLIWAAAVATVAAAGPQMKISSPAFAAGGKIPSRFTCDGANTSPELHLGAAPDGAKSLVLIVEDPDAPTGLFTHWMLWNLDPKLGAIGEGGVPSGIAGRNDFGEFKYSGPCPPSGTHRYVFKIFALDRQLDLNAGAKRKELDSAMNGHVIAQGELTAMYSRAR